MPRKKSAEQIRKNRRKIKWGIPIGLLILLLICAGVVYAGHSLNKVTFSQLQAYELTNTINQSESSEAEVSLFGENLAAPTQDVGQDGAITAGAAITFSLDDGEICYSKNALKRMEPASITKVMTCLVALKYGALSKEITVTSEMLDNLDPGSSLCHITADCTLTLEQLLYGLMLPSGNDAANAIAYCVAGSEQGFVDMMNEEAQKLGACGTHFANAHGLSDSTHYTTAYDIYLIYHEAVKYKKFLEIIGTQDYTANFTCGGSETSLTWSRGIWYFTGNAAAPQGVTPIGGKTGTTPEAGFCLSLLSEDEQGNRYVSVVLNAYSRENLYSNMTALLSKITN